MNLAALIMKQNAVRVHMSEQYYLPAYVRAILSNGTRQNNIIYRHMSEQYYLPAHVRAILSTGSIWRAGRNTGLRMQMFLTITIKVAR